MLRGRRLGVATATAIAVACCSLGPPSSAASDTARAAAAFTDVPVQETGRITKVLDGDTFEFLQDGDSRPTRVRLLGVNTPEVTGEDNAHFDADMCAGREAEAQLESLLPAGTKVQLRALHKDSTNRGRILRYVLALDPSTGQYDVDVSAKVAESGLAMWFTVDQEAALAHEYRLIVLKAQRGGRGIWDPNHCGPIEQPDVRIRLTVVWDAPGADPRNLNGEYVIVRNVGPTTADLSGWLLRDSSLTSWFYFPRSTVVAPDDYLIVHVGSGTPGSPTFRSLYMNATDPLFPNPQDGKFLGDGAYLLDRNTAVRFYDEYPCILQCDDPHKRVLRIAKVNAVSRSLVPSRAANEEFIVLRNAGAAPILLDGYYLRRKVSTYQFPPDTHIQPGAKLTIRIGKGAATSSVHYWGRPAPLLTNRHDTVQLLSSKNVLISQRRW